MKRGFTLIELIVVMLILTILVAAALPLYESAVDQGRWSTLLPVARALKESQERMLMTTGFYTDSIASLDIDLSGTQNENSVTTTDAIYTLENKEEEDPPYNAIAVQHVLLPNNRLMLYLDRSSSFSNNMHCEARTSNVRAMHLCSALTDSIVGTRGEYTVYLVQ